MNREVNKFLEDLKKFYQDLGEKTSRAQVLEGLYLTQTTKEYIQSLEDRNKALTERYNTQLELYKDQSYIVDDLRCKNNQLEDRIKKAEDCIDNITAELDGADMYNLASDYLDSIKE
jgi:predicted RNase H-like nuclease (RuvC/YqgF family)